jgi:hypothetical protein
MNKVLELIVTLSEGAAECMAVEEQKSYRNYDAELLFQLFIISDKHS